MTVEKSLRLAKNACRPIVCQFDTDTPPRNAISYFIRKQNKTKYIISVLKCAPNFFLRDWKHSETTVAEEYCWTIKQAVGRSCCGRLGSSALDFSWPSLHTVHTRYSWPDVCSVPNCAKNRLALYFAERSSYVSRSVCVCVCVCVRACVCVRCVTARHWVSRSTVVL